MIYFVFACLLTSHVLSVPVDYEKNDETTSQILLSDPLPSETSTTEVDTTVTKPESDLKTEPSLWWSYHSIHNHPLVVARPRVYTYYADYVPSYTYWSTW